MRDGTVWEGPGALGSYATVVADVAAMVDLEPVTAENTAGRWVTADEMTRLPLHPGVDQVVLVSTRA